MSMLNLVVILSLLSMLNIGILIGFILMCKRFGVQLRAARQDLRVTLRTHVGDGKRVWGRPELDENEEESPCS